MVPIALSLCFTLAFQCQGKPASVSGTSFCEQFVKQKLVPDTDPGFSDSGTTKATLVPPS